MTIFKLEEMNEKNAEIVSYVKSWSSQFKEESALTSYLVNDKTIPNVLNFLLNFK